MESKATFIHLCVPSQVACILNVCVVQCSIWDIFKLYKAMTEVLPLD